LGSLVSNTRSFLARTSAALLPLALAVAGTAASTAAAPGDVVPTKAEPKPKPVHSQVEKHRLAAPDQRAETARLSMPDAKEARSEAKGRAVRVASASTEVALPDLAVVGVNWRQGSAPGTTVQYRTKTDAGWGTWQFVDAESDHRPDGPEAAEAARRTGGAREASAPIVTTGAKDVQVRLVSPTGTAPADPQLVVVDPGTQPADGSPSASPAGELAEPSSATSDAEIAPAAFSTGVATKPTIYTRAQWGADETLRDQSYPDYGVVEAAFVHHTAGTNNYTADQVPGIIRGIYAFHVQGNGWRDIGYNFLVDKFGRTWEGRWGGMDKAVVGAHTYGLNYYVMGVSVLGNYETAQPTSGTITALAKLIAWKASIHHFDVLGKTSINGTTYNNISGHRNAKDNYTECPGQYLYAKLSTIREQAATYTPAVARMAGSDRYATAAAVSAQTFGAGAPVAYVATGTDFPDALAGAAAAGSLGGPILLTQRSSLPAATATELRRLKPRRIVVLGSTGVISASVESTLRSYAGTVQRQAGSDRYATAAAVSRATFGAGAPVAYVATGTNFPDALAGGPAGGAKDGPVLLVKGSSIPPATATELGRLKPKKIVVLGSTGVVPASVEQSLRAYSTNVSRAAGSDRYGTAAKVSATTFGTRVPIAFVATGADFPDALAGGPAGGFRGGPILLTQASKVPQATLDELTRLKPARIVVLGSAGVVSDAVAKRLWAYEVPPTA
jgi:putative cell wall-binding protein